MCFLNKKCHPLFELLHRTALARSQAYLSFEVHLLFFPSNTDEKLSVLTSWPFWCFLHLYRQGGGLNLLVIMWQTLMTKLIKLLVSVVGDVTSACIKLLSVGMTSILHI